MARFPLAAATPMRATARGLLALACLLTLIGCSAKVVEHHYFATYAPSAPEDPVNFFRVDVTANTTFSNARYVSGFYDERAVDLFFSELKATDQALFKPDQKDPGTDLVIKPLDGSTNGAFVMVLSTNADDIVNSISAFAESEVVGSAVTQLVNRSELMAAASSDAAAESTPLLAAAFASELDKLISTAAAATSQPDAEAAYLRVLQRLTTETSGRSTTFGDFNQALVWFEQSLNGGGVQ